VAGAAEVRDEAVGQEGHSRHGKWPARERARAARGEGEEGEGGKEEGTEEEGRQVRDRAGRHERGACAGDEPRCQRCRTPPRSHPAPAPPPAPAAPRHTGVTCCCHPPQTALPSRASPRQTCPHHSPMPPHRIAGSDRVLRPRARALRGACSGSERGVAGYREWERAWGSGVSGVGASVG